MKQKRNTIILTAVLLAIALGGLLAQRLFMQKEGACAVVQSYGEVVARLPLAKTAELLVGDEKNGYNRVCTGEGFVYVQEADCPDKICVQEGRIHSTGEAIACLPHELIITIEDPQEEIQDAAAW